VHIQHTQSLLGGAAAGADGEAADGEEGEQEGAEHAWRQQQTA
jgi:hypothetical protein